MNERKKKRDEKTKEKKKTKIKLMKQTNKQTIKSIILNGTRVNYYYVCCSIDTRIHVVDD